MTDLEFLMTQGIPFTNVNDMWMIYWDSLSVEGRNFNDRMYRWLGSIGYEGSLSDRYKMWQRNFDVFDGILFTNGGMEIDLSSWSQNGGVFTHRNAVGGGVDVSGVSANNVFFENATLPAGLYRLTCGSSTGGLWLAADLTTGVPISEAHEFVVDTEAAFSNGVYAVDGSPDYFFDNLRLEQIDPPANAVTYNGILVTNFGKVVTYTP